MPQDQWAVKAADGKDECKEEEEEKEDVEGELESRPSLANKYFSITFPV